MEMTEICRCCMQPGNIDIYRTFFNSLPLVELIEKCTYTTIDLYDNLPKKICKECCLKLELCYTFLDQFFRIQQVLFEVDYKAQKDIDCKNKHSKSRTDSIDENQEVYIIIEEGSLVNSIEQETGIQDGNSEEFEKFFIEEISEEYQSINGKKRKKDSFRTKNEKEVINEFKCLECNEGFNFNKLLLKHYKETGHFRPRKFQCDKCFKKFWTKDNLKSHSYIHMDEKPYNCALCCKKFKFLGNLSRHMKRHTDNKLFYCDICGKGFTQKTTLTAHLHIHSGNFPYICEICGKGFRMKGALNIHLKAHQGFKLQCEVCSKLISQNSYSAHMKAHYSTHPSPHSSDKSRCSIHSRFTIDCEKCTKLLNTQGEKTKKFECDVCGKAYSYKASLCAHKIVHTRKNECTVCFKRFTSSVSLNVHKRIHSGEKPHICEVCGKAFIQISHLGTHMKTHTGERNYTCKYCDKSFALNGNLTAHMKIHTGDNPHHCIVCGKGFSYLSRKKKHELLVHQIH